MKSTDLKKLPFAQTLPEARKKGATVRLFGRNAVVENWEVVEVDKANKLLLVRRMSQDERERSGTMASK